MKFTDILVPRSYKKLLVRTVMDLKLNHILMPKHYYGGDLCGYSMWFLIAKILLIGWLSQRGWGDGTKERNIPICPQVAPTKKNSVEKL